MTSSSTPAFAQTIRQPVVALITAFAVTSLVTYSVWHFTSSRDEAEARVGFEARAQEINVAVRARMRDYEQALLSMSTVFASGAPLTQARWIQQFERLRLERNFPGFQGIGYAPWVTLEVKLRHEAELRANEYSDYAVRPEGERPGYAPVIFLTPASERHRRAIGFDPYHEPSRRITMDAARDKGSAAITGKTVLSQEQKAGAQPGFVMYMPVYRHDAMIATTEQRRSALQGYVFSTFRMHDLINGMFPHKRDLRIEISDGKNPGNDSLMYDRPHPRRVTQPCRDSPQPSPSRFMAGTGSCVSARCPSSKTRSGKRARV